MNHKRLCLKQGLRQPNMTPVASDDIQDLWAGSPCTYVILGTSAVLRCYFGPQWSKTRGLQIPSLSAPLLTALLGTIIEQNRGRQMLSLSVPLLTALFGTTIERSTRLQRLSLSTPMIPVGPATCEQEPWWLLREMLQTLGRQPIK
jgi:hypothetical protein